MGFANRVNWTAADAACAGMGATLASFASVAEAGAVMSALNANKPLLDAAQGSATSGYLHVGLSLGKSLARYAGDADMHLQCL